jgi:aminoglycoside phosphotransferase family enzyme/adenylate kinase family enzyme
VSLELDLQVIYSPDSGVYPASSELAVTLIDNLQNPQLYDHPVDQFEVIETHISWVLLTGEYVYKIKKPVDFGFLDFSTLEKRHYFCQEEIRLNRRLAPQLYLDVVRLCGTEQQPVINGDGPVLEYAVRMKQFPQETQLDRLLTTQGLDNTLMDKLAQTVASFHLAIDSAPADSVFGDLEHIREPVMENFSHIRASLHDERITQLLTRIEHWTTAQLETLTPAIQQRKANGFIRECHGDMHLRNIAVWNDDIVIFDCIEFNKNFYWIDVISEIAFLIMDLEDRKQQARATRFLNCYLEITGDYAGLLLLNFYKVYRAMVRAKVDALRAAQEQAGAPAYHESVDDCLQYLQLAEHYLHPAAPCLLINHGMSGSGKSYVSRLLLEKIPAIQLRSDVERKRLFSATSKITTASEVEQGIYTPEATKRTYQVLVNIATELLSAGYTVIIDAANLKRYQREQFTGLASALNKPYFILDYTADLDTLRERITQRAAEASDPSDATLQVLEHQLQSREAFGADEEPFVIHVQTDKALNIDAIVNQIHAYLIKF